MPRLIVPTSADGAATGWFVSPEYAAWQGVERGSGDNTYIYATAVTTKSTFVCGAGWRPLGGRIMAVTAHYRVRQTQAGAGTKLDIIITQNGTEHIVGVVQPITAAWVQGEARVREDWTTTTRFTPMDVGDLGIGVSVNTPPSAGQVEVSELWLEVEYVDVPTFYDPYDGVLPSGVLGPLAWISSGGESAAVNPSNYLQLVDTSTVNNREFLHDTGFTALREDYATEIETRITVNSTGPVLTRHFYTIARLFDALKDIHLVGLKWNGDYYVGVPGPPFTPDDPTTYLALEPLDYLNKDTHFRFVVDRDPHIDTRGKIELFVNYSDTPLLWCWYSMTPTSAPGNTSIEIGSTALGLSDVETDYISWKHFRKGGDTFRSWSDLETADNNVKVDVGDPEIVKLVNISPPGVIAGQSDYACRFELNTPTEECRISQIHQLLAPPPTTYGIEVEYRMDGTSGDGQLLVQRASDLFYWDEGLTTWVAAFTSAILPYQATRTKLTTTTGLDSATDNEIIVTVMNDPLPGPLFTYDILLYKVYLYEE